MQKHSVKQQLKENMVAIISLVIAIIALSYTAWREETTEKNRTIRVAGFEVLKNLGELQIVVNHAFYMKESALANPFLGWGHVSLISDLSQLLPKPVPQTAAKLVKVWGENWENLSRDEEAVTQVSAAIDASRAQVLESIRYLK